MSTLPFNDNAQPAANQQPSQQAGSVPAVPTVPAVPQVPAVPPAQEAQLPSLNTAPDVPVFTDANSFAHAQRVAKMLMASSLVPKEYQNNVPNIMIALEMANRIGASPLMVMQNLNIIQGRPSWSSQFIISAINSCKRFSPLRFEIDGEGDEYGCRAWARDHSGDRVQGPKVTWKMVKDEGWLSKGGSKWKTMPELMFNYRAAAFFGRLYAPDVLMGMYTAEEQEDIIAQEEDQAAGKQQGFQNALNALK
jgi:hypothetical protein